MNPNDPDDDLDLDLDQDTEPKQPAFDLSTASLSDLVRILPQAPPPAPPKVRDLDPDLVARVERERAVRAAFAAGDRATARDLVGQQIVASLRRQAAAWGRRI